MKTGIPIDMSGNASGVLVNIRGSFSCVIWIIGRGPLGTTAFCSEGIRTLDFDFASVHSHLLEQIRETVLPHVFPECTLTVASHNTHAFGFM